MYKVCYSRGSGRYEEVFDTAYEALRCARKITDEMIVSDEYHDLKMYEEWEFGWREI